MVNRAKFLFVLLLPFLAPGCGCGPAAPDNNTTGAAPQPAKADGIELVMVYGSEKEAWIKDVTSAFNADPAKNLGGKKITVKAMPMGSGECIDAILSGRIQAHIVSPASAAFIKIGNAKSRATTGKDLIGSTENLVLSPVVIAMWQPMAEALGWGKKPIGWSDILALARSPSGWASLDKPQWGRFKFGHTHPEFSNSGLIALFAETYAGTGKAAGLQLADLQNEQTVNFLRDIEKAVVHYGSSTGFFGRKMFGNGPEYLSAAVLYENMVIESHSPKYHPSFPIVAIYPKEGTFWSDHPAGVVEREWVSKEQRDAAKIYMQFLQGRPQQEKALLYGFRPSAPEIALAAPIDAEHGVNPKEPQTTLEVPTPEVIDGIVQLWQKHKKHSNIVLVVDVSGSMNDENKLPQARVGALKMVEMLKDEDTLSLLPFNNNLMWADRDILLKNGRKQINSTLGSLIAGGGTALYDAIADAHRHLKDNPQGEKISAVVVLTDGQDTNSKLTLPQLLQRIKLDNETQPIRIFTIGYGSDASKTILSQIADATQAKFYEGTPQNIEEVFKDIATFF